MDKIKKPTNANVTGQQDFMLISVVIALLLFGIVVVYYFALGNGSEPLESDVTQIAQLTPTPTEANELGEIIKVPFDYTVESISGSEILINGEFGLMHLPNNPEQVTVKKIGQEGSYINAKISDLSTGQRVELELNPGKSAIIYIK